MDEVEVVEVACTREHYRDDMRIRLLALWVSGVAVGVIMSSLALGFILLNYKG